MLCGALWHANTKQDKVYTSRPPAGQRTDNRRRPPPPHGRFHSKQKKYLETREQLCGEEYKVWSLSPGTIKTYINALAGIYNTGRKENQFVQSSNMRFPGFNSYFAHVGRKENQFVQSSNMRFPGFNSYFAHVDKLFKVIDAIKEAENPQEEMLQDAKWEKLWKDELPKCIRSTTVRNHDFCLLYRVPW